MGASRIRWITAAFLTLAASCTFPEYKGFVNSDAGARDAQTQETGVMEGGTPSCSTQDGGCSVPTCNNRMKDGKETDIDCGGNCAPCGEAKACSTGSDCLSGACTGGACTPPLTNEECKAGPDCASLICREGKCQI